MFPAASIRLLGNALPFQRKMKIYKKSDVCVLCGNAPATTRDNVPPGSVFNRPHPSDLVRVPSCFECNNKASALDEKFGVYLSLHVGDDTENGMELYAKKIKPTLDHNKRLRRTIVDGIFPVSLRSTEGKNLGNAHAVLWDSESHDRVIERTIRGLHYYHTGVILGERARVKVQYLKSLDRKIMEMFQRYPIFTMGGRQFMYKFMFSPDHPLLSAWLFQFHERKWSSGHVEPIMP